VNDEFRQRVIEKLRRGQDLPADWAPELFPPDKREYELVYHGKEREEDILAETMAVPLQPVSTFGGNSDGWHNLLIFGDNLQAMKTLLKMKEQGQLVNADGSYGAKLIYVDPPFATARDFKGTSDQKAYQDKLAGRDFLEFMRRRLLLLRELLARGGTIYVHLDLRRVHYVKVLMDEVFGEHNFLCEIVWKSTSAHSDARRVGLIHQTILVYVNGENYVWNTQYVEHSDNYKERYYRYKDAGGRAWKSGDLTGPGGRGPVYEWHGITRAWRVTRENMEVLEQQGKIFYTKKGIPRLKQYWDEIEQRGGMPSQSIWDDKPVQTVVSWSQEGVGYPTQKPEGLLARIVRQSSSQNDIVLDAFAGSGTSCAVAEKLGRRWIGIDCGKLAIYTIQKRLLNLRSEIGNKGRPLKAKPFTLHNAGLYDFSTLKRLPWADWRFFALQLFGCRDEPHDIGGLRLDGKLKGASVLVFNHLEHAGKRIDEETVRDIHTAVGNKVGSRFFIVAPRGVFDFQQDYIDLDGVRYYALRIPYSVINELHHREFTSLQQPNDETAVNDTVDAVGFDFIQPPTVDWTVSVEKHKGQLLEEACLRVKRFESRARLRGRDTVGGLETLSMVLLDFDYAGDVFNVDAVFFAHQIEEDSWQAWFSTDGLGKTLMVVFIDIYGNEAREVIPRDAFLPQEPTVVSAKTKEKSRD
jgi:site-specific DNA-methyltransferase (adenine-specific)/adenine-specific DNA-methyltransferase